ncbi:MAG: cytochrome c1 [Rhodobacter sp.]|uniref:cytochrome c1 n=1 Tax=Pararhodobacter sp. TaxID=2127056 RepID=UPI001D9949EF|nr:cytochrome c1 [Pararhodobacter sp.]MCB1343754.1 cytochrome c1 [Paracoccaceae bacterium]MCC0074810.1 cytochrome c1 [Rhodobacter sp.]HPD94054.1 cytochrome c1 [Pararhodobacter sp.]
MIRKLALSTLTVAALCTAPVMAAEGGHIHDYAFSFEGPFGTYDRAQLQRGLQVYNEVCSACHGLELVTFRSLTDATGPGLDPDIMRAFAAEHEVPDGQGGYRTAGAPDHFPGSSLENAPDLSLMAKARAGFHGPYGLGINQLLHGMGGPEYIASFVTGFTGQETEQGGAIFYENAAFGGNVAMPPILSDGLVEYSDGTEATEHQMAQDVAAFLMWAAEPHLVQRKMWGFVGVVFLVLLASLLYLTNKRLWAPVKDQAKNS